MKLNKIRIKGYKCFLDSKPIPIHSLTVFIGENDAGKSSVLTSIGILLCNDNVAVEDYHTSADESTTVSEIEIEGTLELTNTSDDRFEDLVLDGEIKIKRTISISHGSKYFVNKEIYEDSRLNSLNNHLVINLKEICREFNLEESGKKSELITRLENHIQLHPKPKKIEYIEVSWRSISDFLPLFQRFSSNDYGNPHLLIGKVLSNVYRSHFYQTNSQENGEELITTFSELKREIENSLDEKIHESLKEVIQKYNPNVQNVKGVYNIDFGKGLNFNQLEIDTGSGLKPIRSRGEGAKKRLFLSILEWDRILQQEIDTGRGIIKAYDEPDANLHFSAQRRLFYAIQSDSEDNDHVQSIVCTHALTMIDRAPALSINCLVPDQNEESQVQFLETDEDDADIKTFLNQISEISGLKNSSIFYEKCFLLVEGPSEENALPVLYKKRHNRSMAEDGIVLINLESNGSWRNYLKLLRKNKESLTLLFLDADTQYAESTASITKQKLVDIGYSADFLEHNVFWAGDKEFEDTYVDSVLLHTMNTQFPKPDGALYGLEEITRIRDLTDKFSEDIRVHICRSHKSSVGKPELATKYSEAITPEQINEWSIITSLFDRIQTIVT